MIQNIKTSMGKWDNLFFRVSVKFSRKKIIQKSNLRNVPIIINNFNRLEYLQAQISWLERVGYSNIYIVDNKSTYPPLLEFYKKTKYTVYILDNNIGFLALWKTVIFQKFKHTYYVYTDPDILPKDTCPDTVFSFFFDVLQKYKDVEKVGFGLVIDDLPASYLLKEKVIHWEKQFWEKQIESNLFAAAIDTTFALYKPGVRGGSELNAIRTGEPYTARHLSWYIDSSNLTEEEIYYIKTANSSSSWTNAMMGKVGNNDY